MVSVCFVIALSSALAVGIGPSTARGMEVECKEILR